jgi:hypothetical protein
MSLSEKMNAKFMLMVRLEIYVLLGERCWGLRKTILSKTALQVRFNELAGIKALGLKCFLDDIHAKRNPACLPR